MITSAGNVPVSDVQPGDWFVVDPGSWLSPWIRAGEAIADSGRRSPWAHAGIATRRKAGRMFIAQATPRGAEEVEWAWGARPHRWSTGTGLSGGPVAAQWAIKFTQAGPWGPRGVPYSFEDYLAIALHHWRIPAPGLQGYIESTFHMICSQLVDKCCLLARVHLFDDNRWPGYVPPSQLGFLLGGPATCCCWAGGVNRLVAAAYLRGLCRRETVRDLWSIVITHRCWRCGQREGDAGMVEALPDHLGMHYSDPLGGGA